MITIYIKNLLIVYFITIDIRYAIKNYIYIYEIIFKEVNFLEKILY